MVRRNIICLLFVFIICTFFGCGNSDAIYGQWEELSDIEVYDVDEEAVNTGFKTVIVFNEDGTGEWKTEFSDYHPDIIRQFKYITNDNSVEFCYEDGKSEEYRYMIEQNRLTLTSKRVEMVLTKVAST